MIGERWLEGVAGISCLIYVIITWSPESKLAASCNLPSAYMDCSVHPFPRLSSSSLYVRLPLSSRLRLPSSRYVRVLRTRGCVSDGYGKIDWLLTLSPITSSKARGMFNLIFQNDFQAKRNRSQISYKIKPVVQQHLYIYRKAYTIEQIQASAPSRLKSQCKGLKKGRFLWTRNLYKYERSSIADWSSGLEDF